jgi:hypothetical protein
MCLGRQGDARVDHRCWLVWAHAHDHAACAAFAGLAAVLHAKVALAAKDGEQRLMGLDSEVFCSTVDLQMNDHGESAN